jgi:transcription elongation factor GreA
VIPENVVLLSPEGYTKIEQELEHLKSVRRREVAERIKQARVFGDITENSEYDDAKNEQAFIEGRILTLEKILRNARVIDESQTDPGKVGVGSTVKVRDVSTGEIYTYVIIGSAEADPAKNKISNESPVGKGLLGQEVGSTVQISVPAGVVTLEVVGIEREILKA